jgi:hypothetical protein
VKDPLSTWQSGRRRADVDGCLSNLALDRLAQGECPPAEQEQARAHLAACARCGGAAEALAADRLRFSEEMDIPGLARDALARASREPAGRLFASSIPSSIGRWLVPVLGAGLAAAGLLLLMPPPERTADMRAKGAFGVELYVKHAEGPADGRLHLGEALHPGDRVRLRLLQPGRFVAVLAVDTRAAVSVYYPQGPTTAELPAGGNAPLPSAVELDDTLGGEVIVAFSCPGPQPLQSLVAAVQQALDEARVRSDPAAALGPIDTPCVTARYRFDKLPRTGAP